MSTSTVHTSDFAYCCVRRPKDRKPTNRGEALEFARDLIGKTRDLESRSGFASFYSDLANRAAITCGSISSWPNLLLSCARSGVGQSGGASDARTFGGVGPR